ncbi:hypothetical protein [Leptospira soteropolitanensis]|uniref:Lipoprotein n=2 Tax=Leptospira soteropolitanensis TaxID=2950025 RepID=A0AAW5VI49_9LEPT|nr:hypothetical protein [Leptospira soteropolitanensis]MCW7532368.1 hypothetical protein [Leptospira soteropolitanensis]
MKKIILISFLAFSLCCSITKRDFVKLSTNHLKKIESRFNDYVIHFEYPFNRNNRKKSGYISNGIIDSLRKCQIINKRVNLYVGFSKFLNKSSESLNTLTDNSNSNKLNRFDLHLILDDEQNIENLIPQSNLLSKKYQSNDDKKKLINFNLYHYSISKPMINFEFLESAKYVAPRLEKEEFEEYFNFGKLIGTELCDALKNI